MAHPAAPRSEIYPLPLNPTTGSATPLFCGAEIDAAGSWDAHQTSAPHFLPSYAPDRPLRQPWRKSTGCGWPVHSGATSSQSWHASTAGISRTVIALEDEYFPPGAAKILGILHLPCGCEKHGVGCQICGNALGAMFNPCARHAQGSSYRFLPSAVSPPLPINALPPDPPSEPTAFQAILAPIRSRRSRAVLAVPTAAELQLARDAERDFAPQLREMALEAQTFFEEGQYEAQMEMAAADDEARRHAEARVGEQL
ncbi:hypothetical protein C8J57DRAFT_1680146 [Mycena rebaudengoi]|nr:hypothetical protein C8J57DRAFT_1680146 [Mycena rebaudengoi]